MAEPTLVPSLDLSQLPAHVAAVFTAFRTCELSTIGRDGTPIAWPVAPILWPERGAFVVLTSIGMPQKALNVRRNPRVALLFSDPTGSGLTSPPTVLVQGDAVAPEVVTSIDGVDPGLVEAIKGQARRLMRDQPSMAAYLSSPLTRALMDWYFIRIGIFVAPRRVRWWERGDMAAPPNELETSYVA